ncbi:hypothetical protein ACFXJ8_42370 [Nonomuraea sp. NPDC059194]|uniref:hypothetical protein n=1 Tax=Nonomuraea sp. NPDC059194 TaxID=3346764 RepID=UPI0036C0D301
MAVPVTWLFPGRVPGRPASTSGFSGKLLDHGVDTRPTRNAAHAVTGWKGFVGWPEGVSPPDGRGG